MNTKILLAFLLILFIGCKKNENSLILGKNEKSEVFVPKYGKLFFDYDEINYYSIDISEEDAMKLDSLSSFSKQNKLKSNLISDDFPEKLSDINFENQLVDLGFKKKKISNSDFGNINKIFVEKTFQDGVDYACIPVYRDILIFKKRKRIIGFSKICFNCNQYHMIGSNGNTDNFGYDNDYENLGKILDKY